MPAPAVHGYEAVEDAERAAVRDRRLAAVGAVVQVVDVAAGCGGVAAGEAAVPVPAGDGAADVHGDGVGGGADV